MKTSYGWRLVALTLIALLIVIGDVGCATTDR